jgi:hypothetical protein
MLLSLKGVNTLRIISIAVVVEFVLLVLIEVLRIPSLILGKPVSIRIMHIAVKSVCY